MAKHPDWGIGAGSANGTTIKQTGRDRSGRVPRASNWSQFYADGQVRSLEESSPNAYDPDSGGQEFPAPPYMANRTMMKQADYHNDPLAHGGANSDSS